MSRKGEFSHCPWGRITPWALRTDPPPASRGAHRQRAGTSMSWRATSAGGCRARSCVLRRHPEGGSHACASSNAGWRAAASRPTRGCHLRRHQRRWQRTASNTRHSRQAVMRHAKAIEESIARHLRRPPAGAAGGLRRVHHRAVGKQAVEALERPRHAPLPPPSCRCGGAGRGLARRRPVSSRACGRVFEMPGAVRSRRAV